MALRKLFNVGRHNGLRLKPAAPSAVSVRSAQGETTARPWMRGQNAYIEDPGHTCCPMQATAFSPGFGARLKLLSKGPKESVAPASQWHCSFVPWKCLRYYVKLKLKLKLKVE